MLLLARCRATSARGLTAPRARPACRLRVPQAGLATGGNWAGATSAEIPADYYKLLGLQHARGDGLTARELQESFFRLSKACHPDVNPSPDAAVRPCGAMPSAHVPRCATYGHVYGMWLLHDNMMTQAQFREATTAYETLRCPDSRRRYDIQLVATSGACATATHRDRWPMTVRWANSGGGCRRPPGTREQREKMAMQEQAERKWRLGQSQRARLSRLAARQRRQQQQQQPSPSQPQPVPYLNPIPSPAHIACCCTDCGDYALSHRSVVAGAVGKYSAV